MSTPRPKVKAFPKIRKTPKRARRPVAPKPPTVTATKAHTERPVSAPDNVLDGIVAFMQGWGRYLAGAAPAERPPRKP